LRYISAFYWKNIDTRQKTTDESNSITNQRSVLINYVRNHPDLKDMKTIEFVDDGYTGTNLTDLISSA